MVDGKRQGLAFWLGWCSAPWFPSPVMSLDTVCRETSLALLFGRETVVVDLSAGVEIAPVVLGQELKQVDLWFRLWSVARVAREFSRVAGQVAVLVSVLGLTGGSC